MDLTRRGAAKLAVDARVATLLLVAACRCWACTCVEIPPCQAYGSSIIFIGKVNEAHAKGPGLFTLQVEHAYKGVPPGQGRIEMFKSGMCNTTEFRLGEKYLVYADGPASEVLYGNTCSRTRHISWDQEDLKYLDGLARAPRGSRIFGSVLSMYGSDGSQRVFVGARVDVAGEGVSRSAKTDRQGRYQVRGLPPGKYAISTKVQGWTLDGPERVKTVDRGCMELDLVLLPGNDERIHQ